MDCTVYTQRKGLYTVEHTHTHTNVLDFMGLHSIQMSNNLLNYSHIGTNVVQPPSQCRLNVIVQQKHLTYLDCSCRIFLNR